MVEELLAQEEGKILEFKENATSLQGIIKTIIAFANTAGGTIIVGVEDKTKKVVGIVDPLEDEMRIINKVSESITPQLRPNMEIVTYRKKTLILIQVPYLVGPYYLKQGAEGVAYVRFGPSNRIADEETIAAMKRFSRNITFDESVCVTASKDSLDVPAIERIFKFTQKKITKAKLKSMGILTDEAGQELPSNGGILLFGKNRASFFPDAVIRCIKFIGTDRSQTMDSAIIDVHLPGAVDEVLHFITKNTFTKTEIGKKRRVSIPQYPPVAVREAVINAIVHADYAIKGSSIMVTIFDDRLEITNPGAVIYGLSLEDALAGSSRVRNRVIARTFHLLELIEQWGSGLQKIITNCVNNGLKEPKFEEIGSQFRVTLYAIREQKTIMSSPQKRLIEHLSSVGELSSHEAAEFWNIGIRSTRKRLKKLVDEGLIVRIGTSRNDPGSTYVIRKT
jgi:ATP-dependent DNA helicase RecG